MKKVLLPCFLVFIFIVLSCGRRKNPMEPEFVNLIEPGADEVLVVTKPSFSWNAVSYAYRYEIQIDDRNSFYTHIVDDSSITESSFVSPISLSDREYWWRVRTRQKNSGWEVWSEVRKFIVAAGTPVPISPVNDTVDVNQPTFTWNAILNAVKYRIQVDDYNTFYSTIIDDSLISLTNYIPDTILIDGFYYWRIAVETGDSEWSDWSNVVSFSIDTNPFKIVSIYQTKGYAMDVVMRNDTAYIAEGEGGFAILDLTDIGNPTLVGECDTHGSSQAIALLDSFAYLAVGKNGVSTVLFNDPTVPVWQSLGAGGDDNATDLAIISPHMDTMSYIFTAEKDQGMLVLQIFPSYPGFPLPFYTFNVPGYENGLVRDSTYLYIACGELGLSIVDISKIDQPEIVGECDTKGYAYNVFVKDSFAFIADGRGGIEIINVGDVTSPSIVGSFDTEDNARDIFVKGDTAFVADENNGLVVLDVSDPTLPQLIGGVETSYANAVWVEDNYALVVDKYDGIVIVEW